jgi:hypothetical protein
LIALPHFGLPARAQSAGMAIDVIALPHFGLPAQAQSAGMAIG